MLGWLRKKRLEIAIITSAPLPASQVPYSQRAQLLGLLDASFPAIQLGQLTVVDFTRNDLLLPASVFLDRLSGLVTEVHSDDLTGALGFVRFRGVLAREQGVRLALTRTNSWSGAIETNFSVFLDV
jgi:hypothetical protein